MISLVERGHLAKVSLPLLRRILAALDARLVIELRWRAGALERLLDEDHAAVVARVADLLRLAGWEVLVEVTYSEWGERGSIDLLAYHAASGTLLVVEVKTDLPSAEAALRKLDEKVRLAPKVARERFGWHVRAVSRLLVMPDTSVLRRRAGPSSLVARVLPDQARAIRRWIEQPVGPLNGVWFLSGIGVPSAIKGTGGRDRVRRRRVPPGSDSAAA